MLPPDCVGAETSQRNQKMLLDDERVGIPTLQDLTRIYGNEISEETRVGVRIDIPTIHDIFFSAQSSIKFHNLNGGINHYKQAAHISFWFQKFKPLRFVAPPDTHTILESAFDKFKVAIFGDEAKFDTDYSSTNVDYERAKEKPLNEFVSLRMAKRLIGKAQRLAIRNLDPELQPAVLAAVQSTHKKFDTHFEELVKGVRYHNYTARGYATMIETIFKVQPV